MPYNNSDGPGMESVKQERKDLMHDNPVVRDAYNKTFGIIKPTYKG